MAMLTLGRLLDGSGTESYRRMIDLMIRSVSLHAVDANHAEYERYKTRISKIQATLKQNASREQCMVAVGAVCQLVEEYNRSVSNFIRAEGKELQHMVSMLTATLLTVSSTSERSTKNLGDLEIQLSHAAALEDIKVVRIRLESCLSSVREEAARQRSEAKVAISSLQEELAEAQRNCASGGLASRDPVTGLLSRPAAEQAIRQAVTDGLAAYVIVGLVEKMQSINARFGYVVGDEILGEFANRVARQCGAGSTFYRWNGPAIVGLLKRSDPLHVVRTEVCKVMEQPLEKAVLRGDQNAFITTAVAWTIVPLTPPSGSIISAIGQFISGLTPAE